MEETSGQPGLGKDFGFYSAWDGNPWKVGVILAALLCLLCKEEPEGGSGQWKGGREARSHSIALRLARESAWGI